MSDKVFDLLEKVYIELQETKKELQETKKNFNVRFDNLESGQKDLGKRISKIEINIEHDISNKIALLYEAHADTNSRLDKIDNKLDEISKKVEKHDIKIQVIEGGKKKKSL